VDRNGNIKEPSIKMATDAIYAKVKSIFDDLGFRVAEYTADELKELVVKKLQGTNESGKIDFFEFAERYIDEKKEKQKGTAINYRIALNNLARYLGSRTLNIRDITAKFLFQYQKWMASEGGNDGKPLGERGQSLYLGTIQTIFAAALQEYNDYDKGEIQISNRPFERFKIPKAHNIKTAEQKALSIEQVRAIRDYQPTGRRDALAHDCFMLSFYLCGMNAVDLYQCAELKDGIITYYRAKVTGRREDKAEMRVRVEPEAQPIVQQYKGCRTVFNFCECYSTHGGFNSALNKGLKIIGATVGIDDLEFYYARHSWATIAENDCNIPDSTVDACLAHSPQSVSQRFYVKKDWSKVYEANRKVLDYVLGNRVV
jgi:integrase